MFWLLLIWFSFWLLLHQHSVSFGSQILEPAPYPETRTTEQCMCTADTKSKQPKKPKQIRKNFCNFQTYKRTSWKRTARPGQTEIGVKVRLTPTPVESHLKSSFKPTKPTRRRYRPDNRTNNLARDEAPRISSKFRGEQLMSGVLKWKWMGNLFGPAWLKVLK